MKSINEMQELLSLIPRGDNAQSEGMEYIDQVDHKLGRDEWKRSSEVSDHINLACDCADFYWEELNAIKIKSKEDLKQFVAATREWIKLVQWADFFAGNAQSKFVPESQAKSLIAKLEDAIEFCRNLTFQKIEKNKIFRQLHKTLLITAHYFMPNNETWVLTAREIAENYRFFYTKISPETSYLHKALNYAELALTGCQQASPQNSALVYGTLGRLFEIKWRDNRTIENLKIMINYFEKAVLEKTETSFFRSHRQ